jgi:hypothetical protein
MARLERALAKTRRHGIISLDRLRDDWSDELTAYWLDMVVTGCEIAIARGGNRERALRVLTIFSEENLRRVDRLFTFQSYLLDLLLRACALIARNNGRAITLDTFLIEPDVSSPVGPGQSARKSGRDQLRDRKKELEDVVGPLLPLYDARAQVLLGDVAANAAQAVLSKAVASFEYESYRFAMRHGAERIRRRAALSIADLLCVRHIDPAVVLAMSLAVFGEQAERFGSDEVSVLSIAVLNRALHDKALAIVVERANMIKIMRTVARDRMSGMLSLARFLVSVSRDEANAVFLHAHAMSKDLDIDAIHQLECLATLSVRAAPTVTPAARRSAAVDLMSVVTDAAIRLSEQEGFPWHQVAEALTSLDLPLAFVAIARWEDSGVVSRDSCLGTVLQTALRAGMITATQATALLPLLHSPELDVLRSVMHALDGSSADKKNVVLEELARDALLGFGLRPRIDSVEVLDEAGTPHEDRGLWWHHLESACRFIGACQPASRHFGSVDDGLNSGTTQVQNEPSPPPTARRLVTTADIARAIEEIVSDERSRNSFTLPGSAVQRIKSTVAPSDRVAFLDALVGLSPEQLADYQISMGLADAVQSWRSPAVEDWCHTSLANVIIERLPGFAIGLGYDTHCPLTRLLNLLAESAQSVPQVLVNGIAAHIDELSARTIYELVILIIQRMSAEQAARILERYLGRLVTKIPPNEIDRVIGADVPTSVALAMGRFLFALLSDCDVRTRYRGAHAVRRLGRLGEAAFIDALFDLYERTAETSFRAPDAPFYWLAARLWLLIAVDRVASENPSVLSRCVSTRFVPDRY